MLIGFYSFVPIIIAIIKEQYYKGQVKEYRYHNENDLEKQIMFDHIGCRAYCMQITFSKQQQRCKQTYQIIRQCRIAGDHPYNIGYIYMK